MFGVMLGFIVVAIVCLQWMLKREIEDRVSPAWLNENVYRTGRDR